MHPNPRIYIKHHQTLCCQSLCHPHRNWSSLAIPSGPEPSRTFRGDRPTLEARFPKRRERWGGFLPFLGAKLEPRFSQIQVLNGQLTNIKQKMFEEILPDMVFNILETKHEPSGIDLPKILLLMSDNRNLFQMSAFEGPGRPQRLWCKGVYFGITLVVQIMRTQHEQHLFSFYSKLCLCKTTFEDVAVSKLLQIHSGLCPKNPWLVPKKNPGTARWFARLTAFCRAQQDGHQHS